jgi:predicted  nucleic acid-binding Zn-ribbon protein
MPDLPTTAEGWNEHLRKNREKQAKEERERKAAAEKEAARQNWIRTGGLEKEFEQAYAEIHREQNKTRLLEAEGRARSAHAAIIKNNF